jgi:protein xylosyltransferase
VYFLFLNGRASRQIRRLIKKLYDDKNYFYIHVDKKQDYLYREMKLLEAQFPDKIYVTQRRWKILWGGTSFLFMFLDSYRTLLNKKEWQWDFLLLLGESSYPIKTREELITFLSRNRNKNFVGSHGTRPDINSERIIKEKGIYIHRK